jgi:hypothetical protein
MLCTFLREDILEHSVLHSEEKTFWNMLYTFLREVILEHAVYTRCNGSLVRNILMQSEEELYIVCQSSVHISLHLQHTIYFFYGIH